MTAVKTSNPRINLQADIKATFQSLDARIRAGGNWRGAARIAGELADKLEKLAEMDDDKGPRVRYYEPDRSAAEAHARKFRPPPTARPRAKGPRTVITDITTRKELPPA